MKNESRLLVHTHVLEGMLGKKTGKAIIYKSSLLMRFSAYRDVGAIYKTPTEPFESVSPNLVWPTTELPHMNEFISHMGIHRV